MVDVLLVVVQLAQNDSFPAYVEELIEIVTLIFSAYFCAEVTLRVIGQGLVLHYTPHCEVMRCVSALQTGLLQAVV